MIRYRALRQTDVKQVREVALKAWKYTYRNIYSTRNIERTIASYYSDESFQKYVFPRIKNDRNWFYVALDGKRIIGYSHIGRGNDGWELLRIYLLPEYIGKGIGKKLLQTW